MQFEKGSKVTGENSFFTRSNRQVETRHEDPVLVKKCNTVRCYNAPHNYLSRLVNKNKDKVKTSTQ